MDCICGLKLKKPLVALIEKWKRIAVNVLFLVWLNIHVMMMDMDNKLIAQSQNPGEKGGYVAANPLSFVKNKGICQIIQNKPTIRLDCIAGYFSCKPSRP